MAIDYKFEQRDDLLYVTTHGVDDSVDEVLAYGLAVVTFCIEHDIQQVLCDERQLEYRLGVDGTYDLAMAASEAAPRLGSVAIVHHPSSGFEANMYEMLVNSRGLNIRFFPDIPSAERWLAAERPRIQQRPTSS